MTLRWKKDARQTGLRAVCAGPLGSALRDGANGEELARVQAHGRYSSGAGWFWYSRVSGEHVNTCNSPVADEATAKAEAMAHVKAALKAQAGDAREGGGHADQA